MSMPVITMPEKPVTLTQAKSDLMESIALEETGLSHIINAEGEKIQAAIAMAIASEATDATQLLAVNASVQETLKIISKVEILLQYKLEIAARI